MMRVGRRSRPSRRAAFTLTEAIASMVIVSIVGLTSSQLLLNASRGVADASDHLEMQADLSAALHRAVQAIRGIGRASASAPAPDILSLTPTEMRWPNGAVRLDGSTLVLDTGVATSEALMEGVTELRIEAFDGEGGALAATVDADAAADVRFVRITITASRAGQTARLATGVFIRSTAETFGG